MLQSDITCIFVLLGLSEILDFIILILMFNSDCLPLYIASKWSAFVTEIMWNLTLKFIPINNTNQYNFLCNIWHFIEMEMSLIFVTDNCNWYLLITLASTYFTKKWHRTKVKGKSYTHHYLYCTRSWTCEDWASLKEPSKNILLCEYKYCIEQRMII